MSLQIVIEPPNGRQQRVALSGRVDTYTHLELDQRLAPLLGNAGLDNLVLDLGGVDYISSAGVRSVVRARKALSARGGKVLVLNPQPQVKKVFDIVKAVPLGDVFRSTVELDAYLDKMQKKVLAGDDDDA
ncbi:MAG: STAS domain-containing protein [Pseudomonadota bacterium]